MGRGRQRTEHLECENCGHLMAGEALVLDDQGIPLTDRVIEGLERLAAVGRIPESAMAHPATTEALKWIDDVAAVYRRAVKGNDHAA
jgi:hypothetical protein